MITLGHSIVWAAVVVYITIRAERFYRDKEAKNLPLADKQFKELSARIDDLQNQVSRVALESTIIER